MRKYIVTIPLLIINLLFIFPNFVSAVTIPSSLEVSSLSFERYNSFNINLIIDFCHDNVNSSSPYNYCHVYWSTNSNKPIIWLSKYTTRPNYYWNEINQFLLGGSLSNSGEHILKAYGLSNGTISFIGDYGNNTALYVPLYVSSGTIDYSNYIYSYYYDNNSSYISNTPYLSIGNSFTLTFLNNNTYDVSFGSSHKFPSLYDLNSSVDPYPLTTSFYSLIVSKLILTTEYFTSNYIYLCIFAIILFTTFILLLKRRLFQ